MSPGAIEVKKAAAVAFVTLHQCVRSTRAEGEMVVMGFFDDLYSIAYRALGVDLDDFLHVLHAWVPYLLAIYFVVLHMVFLGWLARAACRRLCSWARRRTVPASLDATCADKAVQCELAPAVEDTTRDGLQAECRRVGLMTSGLRHELEARLSAERERRSRQQQGPTGSADGI